MADELTAGYTTLTSQRAGEVLRVWIDRPQKLNALDSVTLREIGDLFRRLEREHHARVVVLGGMGRSFSVGADRSPTPDPEYPSTDRGRRWHANLGDATEADADLITLAQTQPDVAANFGI